MTTSLALPYSPARGRKLPHAHLTRSASGNHGRRSALRTLSEKRVNGVRVSWFVFGSLFGIGASFLLNLLVTSIIIPAAQHSADQLAALHPLQWARSIELPSVTMPAAPEWSSTTPAALKEPVLVAVDTGEFHGPNLPQFPKSMHLTVEKGDTLMTMLVREDVQYDEAVDVVDALRKTYNPRSLKIGQEIDIMLDSHPEQPSKAAVSELSIKLDPIESVELSRLPSGSFSVEKASKPLSTELALASGTINNSLFETGYENGVPDGVLAQLVKAYSYDVDFQREIQRGDKMEVLFERKTTDDGEIAGYGDIQYAMLKLSGKPLKIYRYESKDGNVSFYDAKGEGIIKALLKTPINGARISSGFGMRQHPILGYSKMHRGTDFAAPKGTPIYASGDGVIEQRGWVNGYGNYIKMRHNGIYESAYGHMSAFARGIGPGVKVKQGQVIGYVGATGQATGPHLHYEIHKYGQQVNPMNEKFKTGIALAGAELQNFKAHVAKIDSQIASMPHTGNSKVASR